MTKKHIISSGTTFHMGHGDVLENIEIGFAALAQCGFRGIDFTTMMLKNVTEDREGIYLKIAELAKKYGLVFAQCHLPFVPQKQGIPDGDAFYQEVCQALDAAKGLGIRYAVMHPNSASIPLEGYNKTAEYDNVMTYFAPFLEYANKIGVDMVVENMRSVQKGTPSHRYCSSPDELCDIADACGIGVCWDTGHANITGLCQSEAIGYVGQRLKVIHLNDNAGDDDVHYVPFMGTVDWNDVMTGLKSIGYEGAVNFEVACWKVPAEARLDIGKYVYKTGEHFRMLLQDDK